MPCPCALLMHLPLFRVTTAAAHPLTPPNAKMQTVAAAKCTSPYVQQGGYCRASCGACQPEGGAAVQTVACSDVPTPDGVTCKVGMQGSPVLFPASASRGSALPAAKSSASPNKSSPWFGFQRVSGQASEQGSRVGPLLYPALLPSLSFFPSHRNSSMTAAATRPTW